MGYIDDLVKFGRQGKYKEDLEFYDGDTGYNEPRVEGERRDPVTGLRIQGVNTAEKGQFGYEESLATAEKYSSGTTIDSGERGYFGRRLGDREDASGQLLSHELLSRGQAELYGDTGSDQQKAIATDFGLTASGLGGRTPSPQMQRDIAFDEERKNHFIQEIRNSRVAPQLKIRHDLHSDAIGRGVDQVQQMGYGMLKLIGDSFGSETLSTLAKAGIDEQSLSMMFNPRKNKSFSEAEGFSESIASVYESLIEQVPNIGVTIATSLATGGIGGLATRAAAARIAAGETAASQATAAAFANAIGAAKFSTIVAPKIPKIAGFATGAKIGAGVASVGMNTGETKITFDREGIDNNSKVLFTGLVKGALDMAGLSKIPGVNRLVGMAARAKGISPKKLWREVPFKVMKAAIAEGTTEALQAVADELAVGSEKPNHEFNWDAVIESFVIGAAAGGAMGLIGSSAETAIQDTPKGFSFKQDSKSGIDTGDKNAAIVEGNHKGQVIVEVNDTKDQVTGRAFFDDKKGAAAYVDAVNTIGADKSHRIIEENLAKKAKEQETENKEAGNYKPQETVVDSSFAGTPSGQKLRKSINTFKSFLDGTNPKGLAKAYAAWVNIQFNEADKAGKSAPSKEDISKEMYLAVVKNKKLKAVEAAYKAEESSFDSVLAQKQLVEEAEKAKIKRDKPYTAKEQELVEAVSKIREGRTSRDGDFELNKVAGETSELKNAADKIVADEGLTEAKDEHRQADRKSVV